MSEPRVAIYRARAGASCARGGGSRDHPKLVHLIEIIPFNRFLKLTSLNNLPDWTYATLNFFFSGCVIITQIPFIRKNTTKLICTILRINCQIIYVL